MNAILNSLVSAAAGALGNLTAGRQGEGQGQAAPTLDFAALLADALTPGVLPEGAAEAGATGAPVLDGLPFSLDAALAAAAMGHAAAAATASASAAAPAAALTEAAAEQAAAGDAAALLDGALLEAAVADGTPGTGAVGGPYRGMERLNGEFRQRFDRVVERMSEEFGHKVEVVETWRDPRRQDALFQQGRTAPGPVVTWTRNSNHLSGRAADVKIDGGYDDTTAFVRLARIAQEEGLRTLGPMDPGHVELPRNGAATAAPSASRGTAANAAAPALAAAPAASAASAGGMAQVARVAEVAQVAGVARVARVATVAQPGRVAAAASNSQPIRAVRAARGAEVDAAALAADVPPPPPTLAPIAAPTLDGSATATAGSGAGESGADGHPHAALVAEPTLRERAEEALTAEAAAESGAVEAAGTDTSTSHNGTGETRAAGRAGAQAAGAAAPATGAAAAERVARALELQNDASARPISSMLLRVEAPGGGEERIRVDLRGTSGVEATLDVSNLGDANRLGARVEDLSRALERHGLEAETIRIRTTPAAETAEAARVAAVLNDAELLKVGGSRTGSDAGLPRERSPQEKSGSEDGRGRADQQGHRSRREPNQEKGK